MHHSVKKLQSVELKNTTPFKLFVWKLRRFIRDLLGGQDLLDTSARGTKNKLKAREVYLKFDDFIAKYLPTLVKETPRSVALKRIKETLERELHYTFSEIDETKPWGA